MKKVNVKRLKIEILVFTILALFSSSILIDQMVKKHKDVFEVKKTEYKFYIKDSNTGEYEEQTSNVFPGEGYYLNIDKTNEECSTGEVDQNDDLSIQALIRFSTLCDLYYDPTPGLTVTSNVTSAVATIKVGDKVVASGTVPVTTQVIKGKNVTITVSDPEYYYTKSGDTYNGYEETFVMTAEDTTKNITLNERPWITGTTSNSSNTTAKTKTDTNWHPGYYLVEVWGGKGGYGDKDPGASGYVYGVVYIDYNTSVYSTAGGNGSSGTSAPAGGANGGGNGGSSTSGLSGIRGGGGGYSAFVVGTTAISQTTINNGSVKILAGGGGGSSAKGGTLGNSSGGAGGAGGNMSSTITSITAGKVFSGSNGASRQGNTSTPGKGGSTSAGSAGTFASAGSLLAGGYGYERGGGGGAGYYGGGGGGVSSLSASNPGGGGGGSSFVASDVTYSGLASSITSKLTSSNPSSTGGAIKIQWIGKTLPS